MPRARNRVASRRRHKKVIKKARGYFGGRSRLFRTAREAVDRAQAYAYRDRRNRKRAMRRLWITRINAAARLQGLSYSRLINGLDRAQVKVNRKVLADIAVRDPEAFTAIADQAKAHL